MGIYLFVIAAILAAISISVLFKINIGKIKEQPEQTSQIQTNFFIGVAISEAIPIVLLIFGLINTETVSSNQQLFIPAIIIILTIICASFFLFLQSKVDVVEENKASVTSFTAIGMAMVNAIPIIALVLLFTFAP
jgi:F0F1-type ATP synthase membrane subunit c/vacuolar-type H+-ATPase subunit K